MPITLGATSVELEKQTPRLYVNPGLAAFLIGGFGLLLVLMAGGKLLLDHFYQVEGNAVVATVTASGVTYSRNSTYHNVSYEFTLVDGRTFSGNQTGYRARRGEPILVNYLRSYPSFNRVAGSDRRDPQRLLPVAVVGIIFLFIGSQSYLAHRRRSVPSIP
jgi:Protein of unknown function (DUF3592)